MNMINFVRTSYENIRDTMRTVFGDAVIDQTRQVWGVDEEGELNGCYGPSGHPGVSQLKLFHIKHKVSLRYPILISFGMLLAILAPHVSTPSSWYVVWSKSTVLRAEGLFQALEIKAIELGLLTF
jgi:hypothetical protein